MKLDDFKQQMGYQKSSSVEHFGSGTSSSDVSRAPPRRRPPPRRRRKLTKSEEPKSEDADK